MRTRIWNDAHPLLHGVEGLVARRRRDPNEVAMKAMRQDRCRAGRRLTERILGKWRQVGNDRAEWKTHDVDGGTSSRALEPTVPGADHELGVDGEDSDVEQIAHRLDAR